jgi:hypothetical protein
VVAGFKPGRGSEAYETHVQELSDSVTHSPTDAPTTAPTPPPIARRSDSI